MDEPLFAALIEWTSASCRSLHQQGWTVTLEEFEEGDRIVLELENTVFLGRFTLQDTGQVELGVRDKRTGIPRRGKSEVYTKEQLKDAIRQFMEWLEQDHGRVQKADRIVCPHGKIGYQSRGQAINALQHIIARRNMDGGLQEYQCHLCHEWHIGGKQGRVGMKRRSFPKYSTPRRKRKDI